jgi:polysaccharide pyruvyl transferase WcaK-like protein
VKRRDTRIAILGHVGNGNLGDEAIIAAVIGNVRDRVTNARIVGFTLYPADTRARHGIEAFPLRRARRQTPPGLSADAPAQTTGRRTLLERLRGVPLHVIVLKAIRFVAESLHSAISEFQFLVASFGRLDGVSALLVTGSQQLSDAVGGPWGFPYTIFKWALLARMRRVPVVLLSVGAGPLDSPLSRWFVRCAVSMSGYRSYRDDVSREAVRSLGVRKPGAVMPDLAFSLQHDPGPDDGFHSPEPIVAINPMPFVWQDYDAETEQRLYREYVGTVSAFAAWLAHRGYRVLFVPTQLRLDPPVINDLLSAVHAMPLGRTERERIGEQMIGGLSDLLATLRQSDVVVATRFHGAVLGCQVGRPVLALAYHQKTMALMAQMGEPAHAVSVQTLRLQVLQGTFLEIERRLSEVTNAAGARAGQLRDELAQQYDRVVTLIRPASALTRRSASTDVGVAI